ncbi:hypothetical protein Dimus_032954 [Dionaea muscipula]
MPVGWNATCPSTRRLRAHRLRARLEGYVPVGQNFSWTATCPSAESPVGWLHVRRLRARRSKGYMPVCYVPVGYVLVGYVCWKRARRLHGFVFVGYISVRRLRARRLRSRQKAISPLAACLLAACLSEGYVSIGRKATCPSAGRLRVCWWLADWLRRDVRHVRWTTCSTVGSPTVSSMADVELAAWWLGAARRPYGQQKGSRRPEADEEKVGNQRPGREMPGGR